jgi:quercetin dioxygenase-like cupin family protein
MTGDREQEVGVVASGDDELGGDPPCWAQLFEDDALTSDAPGIESPLGVVDLADVASTAGVPGVAWSRQSDDLNVNLVVFGRDGGVEAHVNTEVDVLIVALAGEGILEVDGTFRPLRAGQAVVVPKGSRRSIRGASDRFAYLTCHRRRAGLWPAPRA